MTPISKQSLSCSGQHNSAQSGEPGTSPPASFFRNSTDVVAIDGKSLSERRITHKFTDREPKFETRFCEDKCRSYRVEIHPEVFMHEECTPLHRAVLQGDHHKIEELVAGNEDVNAKSGRIVDYFRFGDQYLGSGMRPLQLIAYYGDNELLNTLLSTAKQAGKHVDFYSDFWNDQGGLDGGFRTALALVAMRKQYDMIQTLANYGCDLLKALSSFSHKFRLWSESGFIAALLSAGVSPVQRFEGDRDHRSLILKCADSEGADGKGIAPDCLELFYRNAETASTLELTFIETGGLLHDKNLFEHYTEVKNEYGLNSLLSILTTHNQDLLKKCINTIDREGQTLVHRLCRNYHVGWPYRPHDTAELDATVRMTSRLIKAGFRPELMGVKANNGLTAVDLLKGNCSKPYAGNKPFPEEHQRKMMDLITPPHESALALCNEIIEKITPLTECEFSKALEISSMLQKYRCLADKLQQNLPYIRERVSESFLTDSEVEEPIEYLKPGTMGCHHNLYVLLGSLLHNRNVLSSESLRVVEELKIRAKEMVVEMDDFGQRYGIVMPG